MICIENIYMYIYKLKNEWDGVTGELRFIRPLSDNCHYREKIGPLVLKVRWKKIVRIMVMNNRSSFKSIFNKKTSNHNYF